MHWCTFRVTDVGIYCGELSTCLISSYPLPNLQVFAVMEGVLLGKVMEPGSEAEKSYNDGKNDWWFTA